MNNNVTVFQGIIEGGNIYQTDYLGNKAKVGVTVEEYSTLEKLANEYYNKLVELKVIVPPKTNEEMQKEMLEVMRDLKTQLNALGQKVEVLENAKPTTHIEPVEPVATGETGNTSGMANGHEVRSRCGYGE